MTPQAAMKATLEAANLPFKEINVYGSQIVVTAWSREAASKWAELIGKFATVRQVIESRDETQDPSHYHDANPGLTKSTFLHPVWRVFARI